MNPPDISPLVKGAIALVGIALTLGFYGKLEHWARNEALEAIEWKEPLPYFFASPYHASHKARSHAHTTTRHLRAERRSDHPAE